MELANSATARYLFTSWNVIKIFIISNCVQPLQEWQTLKHRLSCVLSSHCESFLRLPIVSCPHAETLHDGLGLRKIIIVRDSVHFYVILWFLSFTDLVIIRISRVWIYPYNYFFSKTIIAIALYVIPDDMIYRYRRQPTYRIRIYIIYITIIFTKNKPTWERYNLTRISSC